MRIQPVHTPQLSERGSMIAPLAHTDVDAALGGLAPTMTLGAELTLYRKAEHHLTVLNYGIGKLIAKAPASVRDGVNAVAARWDWTVGLRRELVRLTKKDLTTVVALADADLAGFYAALAALDGVGPELAAALGSPPPPHVTLYTSDPAGKNGIGLNTVAELDDALAGRHPTLAAARLD
jgi:hypothetical protein